MTKDDVFTLIETKSGPGDWKLIGGQFIRATKVNRDGQHPCPVCWAASQMGVNPDDIFFEAWMDVNDGMGLPDEDAGDIARSADNRRDGTCRERLLKACHLAV